MTNRILSFALLLAVATCANPASKKKKPSTGSFDYYVLSLSWSPEHCAETHDTSGQCSGTRSYGFVVHGLWPNAADGHNPEGCGGPAFDPSFATPDVLAVMPSVDLVKHEWEKHGTCSGLAPAEYFKRILDAYALVAVPTELRTPDHQVTIAPVALRDQFATANPSFGANVFSIVDNGKYLQEVRVCLTKDLAPFACQARGDTRTKPIILRPSR